MKAWTYRRYGSPDVLKLEELDPPDPGADEVLIRVHASGMNAADWHIMRADPFLARLAVGLRKPRHAMIIGSDVAGVVEAVGGDVEGFTPGDRVYAEVMMGGGCTELTAVQVGRVARMPERLSFTEAAAVPMAATTALVAIRDDGRLEPGQSVLVNGASGGVGTFAVQIAVALGGQVTAVCGTRALDLVLGLGAHEVVDYTEGSAIGAGRTYDLVVNIGGTASLGALRRTLTPRGTLAAVGGSHHGGLLGPGSVGIRGSLLSPFVKQRLISVAGTASGPHLVDLAAMIDAGSVSPVIDQVFGFDRTPDAMRYVEEGHPVGKVVVTVPE